MQPREQHTGLVSGRTRASHQINSLFWIYVAGISYVVYDEDSERPGSETCEIPEKG